MQQPSQREGQDEHEWVSQLQHCRQAVTPGLRCGLVSSATPSGWRRRAVILLWLRDMSLELGGSCGGLLDSGVADPAAGRAPRMAPSHVGAEVFAASRSASGTVDCISVTSELVQLQGSLMPTGFVGFSAARVPPVGRWGSGPSSGAHHQLSVLLGLGFCLRQSLPLFLTKCSTRERRMTSESVLSTLPWQRKRHRLTRLSGPSTDEGRRNK